MNASDINKRLSMLINHAFEEALEVKGTDPCVWLTPDEWEGARRFMLVEQTHAMRGISIGRVNPHKLDHLSQKVRMALALAHVERIDVVSDSSLCLSMTARLRNLQGATNG